MRIDQLDRHQQRPLINIVDSLVNTAKTKLMIIDGIAANRNVPVRVEYKNIPLDVTPDPGPRQAVEVFAAKAVGNFRYLATAPWSKRDLDRLDRYWRQGYKTAWKLNERVTNQPWTTPKNMGDMGYTTTLVILPHPPRPCGQMHANEGHHLPYHD